MHRCLTGAVGDVEFEFVVEMNLVHPPVLVMEAAENHASRNLAVLGKGMFVVILHRWEYRGTFNSWPTACDFPFQNNWKPFRCQPIRVSGLTMTKASFQLHKRDQRIREKRAESFNRLGWTCLSS
jgi:hypothetical protein